MTKTAKARMFSGRLTFGRNFCRILFIKIKNALFFESGLPAGNPGHAAGFILKNKETLSLLKTSDGKNSTAKTTKTSDKNKTKTKRI